MEPESLEFAQPAWLYAGLLLCAVAGGLWVWFDRRREADLQRLVNARFRARLLPGISPGLRWLKRGLWLGGALLLCIAAAGPRMGYEWREANQRGIDILFAVDTSRSMLAEDLSPNRLERARMGIQDFVERLHGDRVGLIPFAGSAFPLCPLTNDYDAFRQALRSLNTELIPRQGTDIASAIREAKRLFDTQKNNHRILVLMTDGEDFQEDVDDALKEAKKDGMTIHTIGVASPEGGRIPEVNQQGVKGWVKDPSGRDVITKLGEETLKRTAEETGGLYAPLGRGAEGLDMIYREKLRLVPKEQRESSMQKIPLERFTWPLAAGLLLLLIEFLLPDRRREPRTRPLPSAARRHAAASVVILLGVLGGGEVRAETDPRAIYNEGTEAYSAGDYRRAAALLLDSLKTPDLSLQSRAYYNLGNAYYQVSKAPEEKETPLQWLEKSLKAYEDALELTPGDEDARYNAELVKRKIEEIKNQKGGGGDGGEGKEGDEGKDNKDNKEGKDGKNGEKKDQDKKDQGKPQDAKDQGQQSGEQNQKDGQDQAGQKNGADQQSKGQDGKPESQESSDEKQKQDGQSGTNGGDSGEKKDGRNSAAGGGDEKKDSGEKQGGKEDAAGEESGQTSDKKEGAEKAAGRPEEQKGEGKKDGDKAVSESPGREGQQTNAAEGDTTASQRRVQGQMTIEEARQLLKTMRAGEATVLPMEQQMMQQEMMRQRRFNTPKSSTKGKTW